MKKKIENLTDTCNRLSTEVKNLNKTINNYEQLIGVKDTQLEQFRMSNTVRDNKFNAKIKLVKKKVELQYRQQGEKQRIDLARKIKMNIDKMKHEQTIWKEEFESQMSAQLQAAMSASSSSTVVGGSVIIGSTAVLSSPSGVLTAGSPKAKNNPD